MKSKKRTSILSGSMSLILGFTLSSGTVLAGVNGYDIQPIKPTDLQKISGSQQPVAKGISDADAKAIYLIRLKDAPVASYRGGIQGLQATSPEVTDSVKLDVKSPAAINYKMFLTDRHEALKSSTARSIGRTAKVAYEYFYGNNGMAVWLTQAEAEKIKHLPNVSFVQRDVERELHTDAGPSWLGAPDIWSGVALPPTQGEGIIVGIIDTGINPSNPSFADVGPLDNYDHDNPWGAGNYVGVCNPADPLYDATFSCNDKLIGARAYPDVNGGDARDNNSHGSHTASTAAGNHLDIVAVAPTLSIPATISGVAPHANIVAYSACCTLSALTAAIDHAITDSVDVINYSIGSTAPSSVWTDFDTVGFRNARVAGIFVATSAGNSGPGAETVGSPADAPWLTAVGASTHDRQLLNQLASLSGGDTTAPGDMTGKSITAGHGPALIVHAGDIGDPLCGTPFPPGTWAGQIVVCDRGAYGRIEKGDNVLAGGAGGYVLANTDAEGESIAADAHSLPAVHLGDANGDVLRTWLATGTGHMATIAGTQTVWDTAAGDIMADFSSRGANRALPNIIKPDVSAPGTDILAAIGVGDPLTPEWGWMSGTSMASPHVAGSAALLKGLPLNWTPAEMQSVLMSTAWTDMRKEDGVTPADPFDMGGGSVYLWDIAHGNVGIVLDETDANYLAADPSTGGDPKTLNLASMGNSVCAGNCSWTRTVRSVAGAPAHWNVSVTDPMGWGLSVSPSGFDLMPGGEQIITVQASASAIPSPDWAFGQVHLTRSTTGVTQSFPVAVAFVAPTEPGGSYLVTDSIGDPMCDTGFGGYVNLADFGIYPNTGITGDTAVWSAFSGQNPMSFYGTDYAGVGFTDDGFAVFDPAANYAGAPWTPQTLPDVTAPNAVLSALWGDYEIFYDANPANPAGVSLATDGLDVSIIEYDDLQPFGGGPSVGDFEIIINSTVNNAPGAYEFVFAYSNPLPLPGPSTVGVESADGEEATAYLNNALPAGIVDGLMVCYDYQASTPTCQNYWTLDTGTVSSAETYDARIAIFAGDAFTVGAGGNLSLNTKPGGTVQFYPGFSVAATGMLSVDTNNPAVCL